MATAVLIPKERPRTRQSLAGGRARSPEIYFRKPIDNSRLRRDVDWAKRRECYRFLALGGVVFLFFLLVCWEHFECVRYGYEIQQLRSQQAAMQNWDNRLRMERASLANPQRIDRLAQTELGLIPPQPGQIVPVGKSAAGTEQSIEYARNLPNARAMTGE